MEYSNSDIFSTDGSLTEQEAEWKRILDKDLADSCRDLAIWQKITCDPKTKEGIEAFDVMMKKVREKHEKEDGEAALASAAVTEASNEPVSGEMKEYMTAENAASMTFEQFLMQHKRVVAVESKTSEAPEEQKKPEEPKKESEKLEDPTTSTAGHHSLRERVYKIDYRNMQAFTESVQVASELKQMQKNDKKNNDN